jgi:hypothetical protein
VHAQLGFHKPVTDQQKAKWQAVRAKGRLWYVFRYGIIKGGIGFATLIALGNYFGALGLHWHGLKTELVRFVFRALFFGIFFGLLMWRSNERRFGSDRENGL